MGYGWNGGKEAEVVYSATFIGNKSIGKSLSGVKIILHSRTTLPKEHLEVLYWVRRIEDWAGMTNKISMKLLKVLKEHEAYRKRQAIGFVHRDKEKHHHVHVYVNRIDFKWNAI